MLQKIRAEYHSILADHYAHIGVSYDPLRARKHAKKALELYSALPPDKTIKTRLEDLELIVSGIGLPRLRRQSRIT